MIIERVTEEQSKYAQRLVKYFNFGQRGRGDGNKSEQYTGMLGQTILADMLDVARPIGGNGFDGGFDFYINEKKVDIKTMTRTTDVRDYYVHNFVAYQLDYDVDYYVFASYNKQNQYFTICGCIDKKSFKQLAAYYPMNTYRTRSDGTSFRTKAPLYEINQTSLIAVDSIEQLKEIIK